MLIEGGPQRPWQPSEKRTSRLVFIGRDLPRICSGKDLKPVMRDVARTRRYFSESSCPRIAVRRTASLRSPMWRPSTSLIPNRNKDVDGRNKSGHDKP
jgi:hypothetical protein